MLSWEEFLAYTTVLGALCAASFALLAWRLDWWSPAWSRRGPAARQRPRRSFRG